MYNVHKLVLVVCVISTAAMSGCASFYIQPKPEEDSAQLHILSGHTGAFTANTYSVVTDETCSNEPARWLAGFSWASGSEETVRLSPNKRIFIVASIIHNGAGPYHDGFITMRTQSCRNLASFVPEINHRYEITQKSTTSGCYLSLIDLSKNEAPSSFVFHPFPTCKTK